MNRKACAVMLALASLLALAIGVASADNYKIRFCTINGGGETFTSGGVYRLSGTIGQPDAGAGTGGVFKLRAGFWVKACTEDCDCDDSDVCTYDECIERGCSGRLRLYGDVNGDGVVNVFDVFCILHLIAGEPDERDCNWVNADIEPCVANGTLNVFDIFAVLDAIAGTDPCCGGLP